MLADRSLVEQFLRACRLSTRADIAGQPSPVPRSSGIYGWWFERLPAPIDVARCRKMDGHVLLYVGVCPSRPATDGRIQSTQTLRERINAHFSGNANSSTLRKSIGALLSNELGLQLRRVGAGNRMTFTVGERALSDWIANHTRCSWMVHDEPWHHEQQLIAALDVPLNLQANSSNAFHETLARARGNAIARAKELPVVSAK